jgi:hypothetical protein
MFITVHFLSKKLYRTNGYIFAVGNYICNYIGCGSSSGQNFNKSVFDSL